MIIKYYLIIIICDFFNVFQHLDTQKPSNEGSIKLLNFLAQCLHHYSKIRSSSFSNFYNFCLFCFHRQIVDKKSVKIITVQKYPINF